MRDVSIACIVYDLKPSDNTFPAPQRSLQPKIDHILSQKYQLQRTLSIFTFRRNIDHIVVPLSSDIFQTHNVKVAISKNHRKSRYDSYKLG